MRLIDADALLERAVPHGWSTPLWVSDIVIEDAPTVDAVEVVRCRDCRGWNRENGYCVEFLVTDPNGYCSFGERKE